MDDTLFTIRYPFADGDGRGHHDRDGSAGDDPRRRRRRRAPGRPALPRRDRPEVVVPFVERRVPVDRGRADRPRVRHGRAQGHAGHDPLDFEIGRDHGLPEPMVIGLGRPHERGRGRSRRADAGGGGRARARLGARSAGSSRSASRTGTRSAPASAATRASSRSSRCSGGARWTSSRRPRSRRCGSAASASTRSRSTASRSPRSRRRRTGASRGSSGGATSSRSGTARTGTSTVAVDAPSACAECGSTELTRESDVLDTWFSSALWPFATLGWPDETPELARYYPGDVNSTAREIIRLWENRMIWTGLEAARRGPVHRRDHPLDRARARRPAHVEEPRHRASTRWSRSSEYGADATRYGLLKISSTQDVRFSYGAIEEGRKLAIKLWNVARLILAERRGRRAAAAPREPRGALDPRAARRRPGRARGVPGRGSTSPRRPRRSTTSPSTTSATGTRRRSSRASTTATRTAIATALAALERLLALLHPVMPHVTEEIWSQLPDREARLIVSPWPERGRDASPTTRGALDRVQEAAQIFRRSGVAGRARLGRRAAHLRRGRPSRARAGRRQPRRRARAAAQGGRARARACSRTSASWRTRRRRSSPPSARSSSATAASSPPLDRLAARDGRSSGSTRCALAARRLRARADARAARRARRPAGRVSRDPRRRHERQVDGDGDDRAAPALRGALRRLDDLAARRALERADPGERRRGRLRGGGRARPRAGRAARRDAVRDRHRRGARRVRRRAGRRRGRRGGARRPATTRRTSCAPGSCSSRTSGSSTPTSSATRSRRSRREKLAVAPEDAIVVLPDDDVRAPRARTRRPHRRRARGRRGVRRPRDRAPIRRSSLPGRLERRDGEVRDGAHNPDGARYLVEQLDGRRPHASSPRSSPTRTSTRCCACFVARVRASSPRSSSSRSRSPGRRPRRARARVTSTTSRPSTTRWRPSPAPTSSANRCS